MTSGATGFDKPAQGGAARPACMMDGGLSGSMLRRLGDEVAALADGLDPDNIAAWYDIVVADAVEMAPPWLQDKISVRRDPVLTLQFRLSVSKRAVRHLMAAIDGRMHQMPYSTRLYFLKVQEEIDSEVDRELV